MNELGKKAIKNVLVTGALGGIGTAICRVLHDAGYCVYATCRPGKKNEFDIWKKTNNLTSSIKLVELDLLDKARANQVISDLIKDIEIGYLVNNAGMVNDGSFFKMSAEQWEKVLNCNLNSLFYVTQPIYRDMYLRNFGRIVNISSVNGIKGQFGQTNYSAAKAGILGFTKSLALESARKNITVNAIAPGYVDTPMTNDLGANIMKDILDSIPTNRLGRPCEIAKLVEFVLSDAAGYMTGETISINGGQYMG